MVKERKDESEDNKKIKKESDLKKFLKKRSFLYLMCAVVFVVFFVPDMIAPSDLEKKLTLNFPEGQGPYYTAWDIVKSYKGGDISPDGYTLLETLITQLEKMYPNEQILKHNATKLEVSSVISKCLWYDITTQSLTDYSNQKIDSRGLTWICTDTNDFGGTPMFEVNFTLETYNFGKQYIWNVNVMTNEITPLNDEARQMMDIVEFYD